MSMPPYPILCYTRGCQNLAKYKIAARWSDGVTGELKTYGLCCRDCLPVWFRQSRKKQSECRLASGETLERPGIFHLVRGQRDRHLQHLPDLEESILAAEPVT
jgi:hypothetical protein